MLRELQSFLLVVCILPFAACTHVTVMGVSGPSDRYFFGLAVFRADKNAPITYFRQRSVGASIGIRNATVGYLREDIFQVNNPSLCDAVLVVGDSEDQPWVREIFPKTVDSVTPLSVLQF
jgi:hypothetical protein